jgi:hypothetical protein
MFELQSPVNDVYITQPFGENFVNFYAKLGLKGHNGIDFRTKRGCPVRAMHDGIVLFSGGTEGFGIYVDLVTTKQGRGYRTRYGHLESVNCREGDKVEAGEIIGKADNTGIYTTGDHLHVDLKEIDSLATMNYRNGYKGCINPAKFMPKNWDKCRAYHRYGRQQNWIAEFTMRFKNTWLHKQLIKRGMRPLWGTEEINALVYGGWNFDVVINPALKSIWGYLKKEEYEKGAVAFSR